MLKADTNFLRGNINQLQIELANEKAKTNIKAGEHTDKIKTMFENLIITPGTGIIPAWEKFQYTMTGFTYEQKMQVYGYYKITQKNLKYLQSKIQNIVLSDHFP